MNQLRSIAVIFCLWSALIPALSAQSGSDAQAEAVRIRTLVEAGALPHSALSQAEEAVADGRDDETLRRTLYGTIGIEQLTEQQADDMVAAAQRRLDRQDQRVRRLATLVNLGVAARGSLETLEEERSARKLALDLATARARLLREIADMARVERDAEAIAPASPEGQKVSERYDGDGVFGTVQLKKVTLAFEKEFDKPMPISARGETALHRALGYDHRGRVDVALNPDQPEGVWLRHYLEQQHIPYFAFRAAVRGRATAPHIHLGTPSPRLLAAD